MDGSGRILITSPLRQFAGLSKGVVLVGQGAKFELWDEDKWNVEIEDALAFKDGDMPPELDGFHCDMAVMRLCILQFCYTKQWMPWLLSPAAYI